MRLVGREDLAEEPVHGLAAPRLHHGDARHRIELQHVAARSMLLAPIRDPTQVALEQEGKAAGGLVERHRGLRDSTSYILPSWGQVL